MPMPSGSQQGCIAQGGSRLHAVHGGCASFGKAVLPTTFSYTPGKDQAFRSKRSSSMTLVHAATKSLTNFFSLSEQA